MSFWRDEVIGFALDHQTRLEIEAQREWIAREPTNPRPYCNLARLYRICARQDEALGLLLEAVRLDPGHAPSHVSLSEIYVLRADYGAAWKHARAARDLGDPSAADLLNRYSVAETG